MSAGEVSLTPLRVDVHGSEFTGVVCICYAESRGT